MRPRPLRTGALIAAWLPMFLFWVLMGISYAHLPLYSALWRGLYTIGTAALLGELVWRFCRSTEWPHRLGPGFCVLHFFLAAVYASAWILIVSAIDALSAGLRVFSSLVQSGILGGWFLMGLWLYGVIAGISFAIESQRRAHENENRALAAETDLVAARLEALSGRLHPHFLFNALHTIAALARQDPGQTEDAIEKLGDMLRYTLGVRQETVLFAEEWEFTRRYLEFEALRYVERLRVETVIEPDSMSCSIPPFALQTLVENAVRHSIGTRPAGGRLEINAHATVSHLHVRVFDDGGHAATPAQDGSRFGLHALESRLRSTYSGAATLEIASTPASFQVSLTIPRMRREIVDDH